MALNPTIARRRFLTATLASGATLIHSPRMFAATEFWNAKDPASWTEEEVAVLMSKSPWARAATPTIKGTSDDPTGGGQPMGGRGGAGGGMGRRPPSVNAIVRWESAQPILDALKAPLAADLQGHYIISVTNLPIGPAPRPARPGAEVPPDEALERAQNGATLQVKGKDPGEAGIARRNHIGSILFGFSKDYLHLTANDREIVFKLDTGQLLLSTRFDTKEMTYHGKLAV